MLLYNYTIVYCTCKLYMCNESVCFLNPESKSNKMKDDSSNLHNTKATC